MEDFSVPRTERTEASFEQSPGHNDSVNTSCNEPQFWLEVRPFRGSAEDYMKVFFPYGADEIVTDEVHSRAFIGFLHKEGASLATEKMNHSVPLEFKFALEVSRVSKEVVTNCEPTALFEGPAPHCNPKLSLGSLLNMKNSSPKHVAHYIQQQDDPKTSAEEVAAALKNNLSLSKVRKLSDGLACIMEGWNGISILRNETVRSLLMLVFAANDDENAATASGILIGQLFVNSFVTGDPFELATKLINDSPDPIRVKVVLKLTEECSWMVFPLSSASFLARIADIASRTDDNNLRTSCHRYLAAHFPQNREQDVARQLLFSAVAPQPSSPSTKIRMDELRKRTVYISRIDAQLTQGKLRSVLDEFGSVKKVRICRRVGFATFYGFVEMASAESVTAMCGGVGLKGMKFQAAKNPIQDVHQTDAVEGPFVDGPAQFCTFGLNHQQSQPLKACAVCQ